jgi:hypothetical protein
VYRIGDELAGPCCWLARFVLARPAAGCVEAVRHRVVAQNVAAIASQADAQSDSRSDVGPAVDLATYPSIALFLNYFLRCYLLGVNVQNFWIDFLDHTKSLGPLSEIVGSFDIGELRIRLLPHDDLLGSFTLEIDSLICAVGHLRVQHQDHDDSRCDQ